MLNLLNNISNQQQRAVCNICNWSLLTKWHCQWLTHQRVCTVQQWLWLLQTWPRGKCRGSTDLKVVCVCLVVKTLFMPLRHSFDPSCSMILFFRPYFEQKQYILAPTREASQKIHEFSVQQPQLDTDFSSKAQNVRKAVP